VTRWCSELVKLSMGGEKENFSSVAGLNSHSKQKTTPKSEIIGTRLKLPSLSFSVGCVAWCEIGFFGIGLIIHSNVTPIPPTVLNITHPISPTISSTMSHQISINGKRWSYFEAISRSYALQWGFFQPEVCLGC
jgi:hypothetical protein